MSEGSESVEADEEDGVAGSAAKEMGEEELKAYLAQRESEAPDLDLNDDERAESDPERIATDVSMAEMLVASLWSGTLSSISM